MSEKKDFAVGKQNNYIPEYLFCLKGLRIGKWNNYIPGCLRWYIGRTKSSLSSRLGIKCEGYEE